MDTKWRRFSHSFITKFIVFMIVVFSFTSAITTFMNTMLNQRDFDFGIIAEDSYYQSHNFILESNYIMGILTEFLEKYKNEEYISKGGTINEVEIKREEEVLFRDFMRNSEFYNPEISDKENKKKFEEVYAEQISQISENLIKEQLRNYTLNLRRLEDYKGVVYYLSDGENTIKNSTNVSKSYFQSFPSYMIIDDSEKYIYPKEIEENDHYSWYKSKINQFGQEDRIMYVAFTEDFLNPRIEKWKTSKEEFTSSLYKIMASLIVLIVSFMYLLLIIGRRYFGDKNVQLRFVDRLYNDFTLPIALFLIALWFFSMNIFLFEKEIYEATFPTTFIIATFGLTFVLSLVKHIKNKTFFKHTLIYTVFYKLFTFVKDIYDSGTVGIKIIVLVIGYPLVIALTFFMFPITIGIGVWLAMRKVKEFNTIKEGVKRVKDGDIHHKIYLTTDGELGKLATDINSITDGLNKAVDQQLKSERLKTELITNVSHDIRTPLTAIITYVDLLKHEKDHEKIEEYVAILEQKSQRLKVLTDDLFEASKASSGSIPVNLEKIDIVSLINQGLGEMDDKINELNLEFRLNEPKGKVYIKADGKLLWRAIENLLSNIYKYALKGSRVYIDIEDLGTEVQLVLKNISAYELNITAYELMERFKRGDESRTSDGSGLGLSIAKSLIELQKGSFQIEIDGDLFKAIIKMPKS